MIARTDPPSRLTCKVLLVEDDPDSQRFYGDLLTETGCEVTAATTGEAALNAVGGWQPDVILLDLMLPGKDGVDVARELSRRWDARHIPIILITALDPFTLDATVAQQIGIRRFIYKPCRPQTLLDGIAHVLRMSGYRRAAGDR